ncbi:hypothetical protein C9F11_27590 [Streptomyces sp. YIM 121038]|nr:hypothetical protein C9F11_27590 [Streptomyces sp. YIM 121038]
MPSRGTCRVPRAPLGGPLCPHCYDYAGSVLLLKIYAKCVDGQEQEMNDRIMQGLGEAMS